jgi:anti-anti-sigma regulatory factor
VISHTRASAAYDHVCWSYDDPGDFHTRAREFLADGLAAGERVLYVAPDSPASLVERLGDMPGLHDALRREAAQVVPLNATYSDGVVDPAAQVGVFAVATEEALAAGYTGLRVVADVTSLVRSSAQLDAFARYEYQIDRYMRMQPLSGMCAFDRLELGDRVVATLACMHPETNLADALFRLYACSPADGCVALAGELDASNHELFSAALEWADPRPVDGNVVVQATQLRFIDHRGLMHLQEYARQRDATAILRTSRSAAARLVGLLDLSRVRVEATR